MKNQELRHSLFIIIVLAFSQSVIAAERAAVKLARQSDMSGNCSIDAAGKAQCWQTTTPLAALPPILEMAYGRI